MMLCWVHLLKQFLLRCFRHFRDNLIRKLRELNVTECGQEESTMDVFGGVSEDELHLGLVDLED